MTFDEFQAYLAKHTMPETDRQKLKSLLDRLDQDPRRLFRLRRLLRILFILVVLAVIAGIVLFIAFRREMLIPMVASIAVLSMYSIAYLVWTASYRTKAKRSIIVSLCGRNGWQFSDQVNLPLAQDFKSSFPVLFPEGTPYSYAEFTDVIFGTLRVSNLSLPFFAGSLGYRTSNGKSTSIAYHFLAGFWLKPGSILAGGSEVPSAATDSPVAPDSNWAVLNTTKLLYSSNPVETIANASELYRAQQRVKEDPGAPDLYHFTNAVGPTEKGSQPRFATVHPGHAGAIRRFAQTLQACTGLHADPAMLYRDGFALVLPGAYCTPYSKPKTDFFVSGEVNKDDVQRLEQTILACGEFCTAMVAAAELDR